MKKRLISLLLVFCMVFSLVPTTAFAVTDKKETSVETTNPFKDIKETDWYYDAVQYARMNGFFNGTSKTTFEPNGTMTRGMFVTVLGRMAGVDADSYKGQSVFADVPTNAYYAPYVAWAAKHGVTDGTGDGKFSPDALINRAQLATFFVRYFEAFDVDYETDANITTTPADIDSVPAYAKDAVLKLWKQGLLNGDGTNFNPASNASRAQAATLCMRTDEAVDTWYKEPGVVSDRVKIDPATGEAMTPETPTTPVIPVGPSGGSGGNYDDDIPTTTYYEVTFAMGSGQDSTGITLPETKTYPENTKISLLPTPFKTNGLFLGWYYDSAMENPVGNEDVLTQNRTLYAKMGEVTAVSEQETPNYVTVVVPADQVTSYSFNINGYTADSVEYFKHVSALNADLAYTVSGTKVNASYEQGQTYSIKLADDSAAVFFVNGVEQPSTIRVLNIITEKGEVQNLTLDGDVKYLPISSVSNMTGTALDGLYNVAISSQTGESSVNQNKNVGTFTYTGNGIAVGDTVAIYEGTRPDLRDEESQNEAVAYVEITAINGTTYSYKTADAEEILFTPDVLPVTNQVTTSAVMTLDGETETYNVTVYQEDMQFTDDIYAQMGLDSQTTVDVGDFMAFYSGDLGASATSNGYGLITEITEGVYEGKETYNITYIIVGIDDVMSSMDIYSTRNEDIELTQQQIAQIEADMVEQAISSGFVEEAAEYLTALAIETDGFRELSDDLDMDLSSYSITFADGTPVDSDTMDLMAIKAEITEKDVSAKVLLGELVHFEDCKGVRVELVMTFKVEIGSGENKVEIVLEAIFEQEVLLNINVSGGAVWKWAWIIPYIADYELNANFDVGTFTGIGITATAKTAGKEEEEEGFDWNMSTGNSAGDKIISIGKQIKDLMDKKNEFMNKLTIPTYGLSTDGVVKDDESAGSITSGGLAEKYAAFMENAEESWVEILRVEIFASEGNVDPFHILCYGIGADFVVSANLYVTIGMTFEYGVAKRYNFSLSLFGKEATNEVIDLEEEHYQFDFYVMGTMGIRAGIEFEVAVGLFSLKLDSVGICAEAGAYAQMWGYFYYSLVGLKVENEETGKKEWQTESSYSGAMCIEIGAYLSISFKAQLFSSDKLTYQPTIYENEWPILTIGDVENVYDFAYAEDDDILSMEVKSAKEFMLSSDLFNMNYMDMKSGDIYGSDSDDEDEDGEPDNPAMCYDDDEESRFTIELSNPKFNYNPEGNIITVTPNGSVEEACDVTIRWNHGTLAFSSQPIVRTLSIDWTDPRSSRYITFDSRGGSAVNMISAGKDAAITAPTSPTKIGYTFGGWYEDSDCTQRFSFPSTMPDYEALSGGWSKGITVYAKWIPRDDTKYTVEHYTQEINGKYTLVDTDNMVGTTDAETAAVANTYTGFTAKSFVQPHIAANGSTVVKIYYLRNSYDVTFTYGAFAGSNTPLTYTAKHGAIIYAPIMVLGGYEFAGFSGLSTDENGGIVVTGTATYAAQWNASKDTPYRVEHYIQRANGNGYLLAGDNAVLNMAGETGSVIDLSSFAQLADAGLTYVKATANGADVTDNAPATIAADGSTVVKIYYSRKNFDLILMNGDEQISSTSTVYGTVLQAPSVPENPGYTFGGWYTDAACSEGNEFIFGTATMPGENLTLYIKWTARGDTPYKVEHWKQNATGDGYTKVITEDLTGATGTKTAANAKDFAQDGFKAANSFEQATITADGNTVVKIYYDRKTYNVTFNSNEGSSVESMTDIRHGATITAPEAPTREGYSFAGWYREQSLSTAWKFSTNTVIADTTLYAKWTVGGYTIEYQMNGGSWPQDAEGPTSFNVETDTFNLPTPVKTGYTFTGWTGSNGNTPQNTVTITKGSTGNLEYTANWTINQYTITFENTGDSTIDSITQDYNTAITNKPGNPTKTGYTFVEWDVAIPDTMPAEDMTITATWTANTYEVALKTNGGTLGDGVEDVVTVTYDSTYNLPTPERTGYTFDGWYLGDTKIVNGNTVKITQDSELIAHWTIGGNTIGYTLNDGSWPQDVEIPTSFNVETNTFNLPTPVRTGYTFTGWTGSNGDTPQTTVTIPKGSTGNREYTANWTINRPTITFDTDGGTEIAAITQDYNTAISNKPGNPTKTGYTFVKWDVAIPDTMPAEDMTITAIWSINQYTITFDTDGGTVIKAITQDYGTAVVAPANPTKAGYNFVKWDKTIPGTITQDVTIMAIWDAKNYKVTFNADGGECDTAEMTVIYDGTYNLPTPERTGYTFDGWYLGDTKIVNGNTVKITQDSELTAHWTIGGNTIGYTLNGGNWPQNVEIPTNFNVETATFVLPTPERTGYTFDGWTGSNGDAPQTTVTIPKGSTGDREYIANWTINQYTITFADTGDSTVESITQNYGAAIVAPANPEKEGYTFTGWDMAVPSTMPANDVTITATWRINSYTITFDTDGGNAIGAITLEYGSTINKPSNPTKEGHTFAGWDKEIPDTMPAEDMTITASWTINRYTITWIVDGVTHYTQTADYGTAVTKPDDPTKLGSTFTGWDKAIPSTIKEDLTITAQWSVDQYTITWIVDGKTHHTQTADYGTEVIKPSDPTKTGSSFAGWDVEIPDTVTQNLTITAIWDTIKYTITWIVDGEPYHTQTADYGTEVTKPNDPTKEGHTFTGWDVVAPGTMPAEDMTITAKWEVMVYTITFDLCGLDEILGIATPDPIKVPYGEKYFTYMPTGVYALQDAYKLGYTGEWYTAPEGGTWVNTNSVVTPGDHTLYRQWKKVEYTIYWQDDTVTLYSQKACVGDPITVPENPTKTGYTFAGWNKDIPDTMPPTYFYVKATWTPNEYTVTFDPNGGECDVTEKTVTYKEQYGELPKPTREGYTFTKWHDGINTTPDATTKVSIAGDHTLTARWKINQYTITWKDDDGTEIKSITQDYGTAIEAPGNPTREGYIFNGWSVVIPDTMPATDMTITAKWKAAEYTITYDLAGGTNSEDAIYAYSVGETPFTLTVPTRKGYTFTGWTGSNGNTPELNVTVAQGTTGNLSYTANWQENTYVVQFVGLRNGVSTQLATLGGLYNGNTVTFPETEIQSELTSRFGSTCFLGKWYTDAKLTAGNEVDFNSYEVDMDNAVNGVITLYAMVLSTTVSTGEELLAVVPYAPTDGTEFNIIIENADNSITLTQAVELSAGQNIVISTGDSKENVTITAEGCNIFVLRGNTSLNLQNLTLTSPGYTAIVFDGIGASLTMNQCAVTNSGDSTIHGGAVYVNYLTEGLTEGSKHIVTLTNCTFTGNTGDNGGSLFLAHTDATITNCDFVNNIGLAGSAVYTWKSDVSMTGCTLTGNGHKDARYPHALLFKNSIAFVTDCTLKNNSGAVRVYAANLVAKDCLMEANDTEWGSAIYAQSVTLAETDYATVILDNCSIVKNTAIYGAVYVSAGTSIYMNNCTVAQNCTKYSGAIYVYGPGSAPAKLSVMNSTIVGNLSVPREYSNGVFGCIYCNASSDNEIELTLYNSVINTNYCTNDSDSQTFMDLSFVYSKGTNYSIEDCIIGTVSGDSSIKTTPMVLPSASSYESLTYGGVTVHMVPKLATISGTSKYVVTPYWSKKGDTVYFAYDAATGAVTQEPSFSGDASATITTYQDGSARGSSDTIGSMPQN